MFALATGIDIETGGEDHMCHVTRDTSAILVLLDRTRQRDEEKQDPWHGSLQTFLDRSDRVED